jgi:hypothetical protein
MQFVARDKWKWHTWFAWYPVEVEGRWYLFEQVERKWELFDFCYDDMFSRTSGWVYRVGKLTVRIK